MRRFRSVSFLLCLIVASTEIPALGVTASGLASIFTVNSTADFSDSRPDGVCSTATGQCTLRAAIEEANASMVPATIGFLIPGPGIQRIAPSTRLPALMNPNAGITVDGFTQPGATPNTDPLSDNAVRQIEIVGQGPSAIDGIIITSSGNAIRGISIHGFRRALWMYQ